jgi:hypothetical protein
MPKRVWVCVFAMSLMAVSAFGLTTKSVEQGLKPEDVAAFLTGPGATITNVKITGSTKALGTFAEGALGIGTGIILSSGDIADAIGPNESDGSGAGLGTPGDTNLDAIVAPRTTNDAIVLEFDVVTATPVFTINYVFASEEYREFVDDEFNDVFAFYVDGVNIAIAPGTSDPVTINTINHLRNTEFYRDNAPGSATTEFDGFTVPMTAVGLVEARTSHHIKIAIADTADAILDSAVFIAQGGITGTTAPIIIPRVSGVEARFGEPLTLDLPIYYVFDTIPYQIDISGVPGATATFSPVFTRDGQQFVTMTLNLGPDTPSGEHTLNIRTFTADAQRFASIVVVVDCKPPALLGTGQPLNQTVTREGRATFTVAPIGSGPFSFQWFRGFSGMTFSPVAGATAATFQTPSTIEPGFYWVRVTNPCGSFNSNTVLVTPQ